MLLLFTSKMYFLWGKLDWLEPSENAHVTERRRRQLEWEVPAGPGWHRAHGHKCWPFFLEWPGILSGLIKPWGSLQI